MFFGSCSFCRLSSIYSHSVVCNLWICSVVRSREVGQAGRQACGGCGIKTEIVSTLVFTSFYLLSGSSSWSLKCWSTLVTSIKSKYEIEMLTSPFNLSEMQMLPDITTICTNEWHSPRILFSFACGHHYQIKIMHFVCKWNRMRSNEIKTISTKRVRATGTSLRMFSQFHDQRRQ